MTADRVDKIHSALKSLTEWQLIAVPVICLIYWKYLIFHVAHLKKFHTVPPHGAVWSAAIDQEIHLKAKTRI